MRGFSIDIVWSKIQMGLTALGGWLETVVPVDTGGDIVDRRGRTVIA